MHTHRSRGRVHSRFECQASGDRSLSSSAPGQKGVSPCKILKLSEDTGATVETVVAAMMRGGDPRNWQTHQFVAGIALHSKDKKVHDPAIARRFYESALRLGRDRMSPTDLWLCEEGIGLSWLMQDDGVRAIPHLERGLAMAQSGGDPKLEAAVAEGRYNLMCAKSLAGDPDGACAIAKDYLESADPKETKSRIKEIAKDSQLKALSKSDCYRSLLKGGMSR